MERTRDLGWLVEVLAGVEPGVSAEDVRDALWLALETRLHLPLAQGGRAAAKADTASRDAGASDAQQPTPSPAVRPEKIPEPTKSDADTPAGLPQQRTGKQPPDTSKVSLYSGAAPAGEADRLPASPSRVPGADALANRLPLARALRPLRRKTREPGALELDEECTAEVSAGAGGSLQPVFRTGTQLWYDLVLVADAGSSMDVWAETLKEFASVCRLSGAFRDVRSFSLSWRGPEAGKASSQALSPYLVANTAATPLPAAALAQFRGHRLVLFASNGSDASWSDGRVATLLADWGRSCSVALLQLLPESLWARVRSGEPSLLLRAAEPGTPAASLVAKALWWDEPLTDADGEPVRHVPSAVPVLPLEPAGVLRWARMQMGSGQWVPAVVPVEDSLNEEWEARTPEQWTARVNAFSRTASPGARSLAVYLSGGDFTLPVARLLQAVKFGAEASQTQLAELLLSGLVQRITPPGERTRPDWVQYRFHPEAARILNRSLRETDKQQVLQAISEHIERHLGRPLDFYALVHDEGGLQSIPRWAQPFARVGRALASTGRAQEPPDDGRPTVFLMSENVAFTSALEELAGCLTAEGLRVLVGGRHRVPRRGVVVSLVDGLRFPPTAPDWFRAYEQGLEEIAVLGPGKQPAQPGNLRFEDFPSVEALAGALAARVRTRPQEPVPPVRGVPPIDREQWKAWAEQRHELLTILQQQDGSQGVLILYSNEAFDARECLGQALWSHGLRGAYPGGIQWIAPGAVAEKGAGQLIVQERPSTTPDAEGGIWVDPEFVAIMNLPEITNVYEGAERSFTRLFAATLHGLEQRDARLAEGVSVLPDSLHLLTLLGQFSAAPLFREIWPRVLAEMKAGLASNPAVNRELLLRTTLFAALPKPVRDLAGRVAVTLPDPSGAPEPPPDSEPEDTSSAFFESFAALVAFDIVSLTPAVQITAAGLAIAKRHPDWPAWNRLLLQRLLPHRGQWPTAAAQSGYLRRHLMQHLCEAGEPDRIPEVALSFPWWALRLGREGTAALLSDLHLAAARNTAVQAHMDTFAGILGSAPHGSVPPVAEAIMRNRDRLPSSLVTTASYWIEEDTHDLTSGKPWSVLVAGSRDEDDLEDNVRWFAEALGEQLGKGNFHLICGSFSGVDEVVKASFLAAAQGRSAPPAPRITVLAAARNKPRKSTALIQYRSVQDQVSESVALADGVVLLGGAQSIFRLFEEAKRTNKHLFPVPGTGRAAKSIFFSRSQTAEWVFEEVGGSPWTQGFHSREGALAAVTSLLHNIGQVRSHERTMKQSSPVWTAGFYSTITIEPPPHVAFADPEESHGLHLLSRGSHELHLDWRFRMGEYPVTNAQYLAFMKDVGYLTPALRQARTRYRMVTRDGRTNGPASWASGDRFPSGTEEDPVSGVSHIEAAAFANWLQQKYPEPGWRWCLPPEDHWEFSARSGEGHHYPWGNEFLPNHCNSRERGIGTTTPVEMFPEGRSASGCAEMAGNVWEHVDAAGTTDRTSCVLRGGSYLNESSELHGYLQLSSVPVSHRALDFGFRCAQRRTEREAKPPR